MYPSPRLPLPFSTRPMTDSLPLSGRTALVTGASAGIGRAIALSLSRAGAAVAVTARRAERLEALCEEIRSHGGHALPLAADAASLEEVQAVVARTTAELGGLDILVNNAGIMKISPITENRIEDWTRMVDVNVKGVLHFLSASLPHMLEQKSGHIVSIGSVAGRRPFPGAAVYSATKFAMRSLGWGLHLELGNAHGIRVTDIQPGYVATELIDDQPDLKAAWDDAWSGLRTLQPEDVARAVEFAVTAPDHVSVSEILVRPTDQPT